MEEEVGEQIVRITENALRYSFDSKEESTKEKQKQLKKDGEKQDKLIEKHRRPKNIPNLATPMIDEFLWRQLNVKDADCLHTTAVSNYNHSGASGESSRTHATKQSPFPNIRTDHGMHSKSCTSV